MCVARVCFVEVCVCNCACTLEISLSGKGLAFVVCVGKKVMR